MAVSCAYCFNWHHFATLGAFCISWNVVDTGLTLLAHPFESQTIHMSPLQHGPSAFFHWSQLSSLPLALTSSSYLGGLNDTPCQRPYWYPPFLMQSVYSHPMPASLQEAVLWSRRAVSIVSMISRWVSLIRYCACLSCVLIVFSYLRMASCHISYDILQYACFNFSWPYCLWNISLLMYIYHVYV